MKKSTFSTLLFAAMAMTTAVNAQVINGDLNHNNGLDVEDVTLLIDGYLTGTTEQIQTAGKPYDIDNSLVSGTWYRSKKDKFRLKADGTTDYAEGYTYKFFPLQGCIVFYNSAGNAATYLKVLDVPADKGYLVVNAPGSSDVCTYHKKSTQMVKNIVLSASSVSLRLEESYRSREYLKATVFPSDAENTSVEWISSDKTVATVNNRGYVEAVSLGTAYITCAALDGSGVKATCKVNVGYYENDHEVVDLGLSVKWATMNIGATYPESWGDFFAWGETKPKSDYYWTTYKWSPNYDWTTPVFTKYNQLDNKTTLDLSDDAANANWGGAWRMPTYDEMNELVTKCMWTQASDGCKVTGPNGNSIYLPGAGYRYFDSHNNYTGENLGFYWSSTLSTDDPEAGCYMRTGPGIYLEMKSTSRCDGQTIRAVCP